ncbi:hypothetical protein HN011_003118 [Eciton burchellii]|nr:hypothetical protein HN011_003118 [Eciton burchellii]
MPFSTGSICGAISVDICAPPRTATKFMDDMRLQNGSTSTRDEVGLFSRGRRCPEPPLSDCLVREAITSDNKC